MHACRSMPWCTYGATHWTLTAGPVKKAPPAGSMSAAYRMSLVSCAVRSNPATSSPLQIFGKATIHVINPFSSILLVSPMLTFAPGALYRPRIFEPISLRLARVPSSKGTSSAPNAMRLGPTPTAAALGRSQLPTVATFIPTQRSSLRHLYVQASRLGTRGRRTSTDTNRRGLGRWTRQ